jgi:RNA polymerase sigma-70 factor (ECF subfamily)
MNRGPNPERETGLLERIAAGDEGAFRELYNLCSKSVYAYIFRMLKDKTMAEDVQIEVFAQVWKGAGTFKGRSQVKTWIFGIARNLTLNELRKRKNHLNLDDFPQLADHKQPEVETSDQGRLIKQAMAKISPKHREILDLVFFHELRYEEIATILKISVNTVKTRVFYAKEALKQKMTLMGVSHGYEKI